MLRGLAWTTWLGALTVTMACQSAFVCNDDAQCMVDGRAGMCQAATGFCSFPDERCESGQRYGDAAPDGLAGECVPFVDGETDPGTSTTGDTGDTGDTSSASSSAGSSGPSVDDGTTAAGSSSTGAGSSESSTDDGSNGDSSSGETGAPPLCCSSECPMACAGAMCEVSVADDPEGAKAAAEAIGVADFGDYVVWSTGGNARLRLYDVATGEGTLLAQVDENSFVTRITGDGEYVYFLDWANGHVRRASVPGGEVELIVQVPDGSAAFGGIAVDGTHVYFALRGSGGVWRAPKIAGMGAPAEMVSDVDNPFGVVVDDTHVYFVAGQAIRRIALDEIGADLTGTVVVTGSSLQDLAVDATHLYFGSGGGALRRADKLGTNQGVVTLASEVGQLWRIAVDDTDVYFTSLDGIVGRIPKDADGGVDPETLAAAGPDEYWGLALGCDAVYWAHNGMQRLLARSK